MNHIRQQALGNIVIMLYLGARVFVREENPIYKFVRSMGGCIDSVQDLEKSPAMLKIPLNIEEKRANRLFVENNWSRVVSDKKTQILIEKLMQ